MRRPRIQARSVEGRSRSIELASAIVRRPGSAIPSLVLLETRFDSGAGDEPLRANFFRARKFLLVKQVADVFLREAELQGCLSHGQCLCVLHKTSLELSTCNCR